VRDTIALAELLTDTESAPQLDDAP
jgi:hypothetical protein